MWINCSAHGGGDSAAEPGPWGPTPARPQLGREGRRTGGCSHPAEPRGAAGGPAWAREAAGARLCPAEARPERSAAQHPSWAQRASGAPSSVPRQRCAEPLFPSPDSLLTVLGITGTGSEGEFETQKLFVAQCKTPPLVLPLKQTIYWSEHTF